MIPLISVKATSSNSAANYTILLSFLLQFQQKKISKLSMKQDRVEAACINRDLHWNNSGEQQARRDDRIAISEGAQSSSNQPSPLRENRSPTLLMRSSH